LRHTRKQRACRHCGAGGCGTQNQPASAVAGWSEMARSLGV